MIENLRQNIARHRKENPHAHARDVASALGVSEAELVASRCGEGVVALDARYKELVEGLVALGSVKTMTRDGTSVLERWGAFETVEIEGAMGQVVGDEIDLRLFLRSWRQAFAVEEPSASGVRRSEPPRSIRGCSDSASPARRLRRGDRLAHARLPA